jgi:hypothetical protein
MRVIGYERLRYHVQSRREASQGVDPWLVDIGSYGGLGRCTCEHFTMTIAKEIKKLKAAGEFKPNDSLRCQHIICARRYAFDELLASLIKLSPKDYPEDE